MYANGRAKGPGRWTRRGLAVSRSNDCKPLPFSLQILPMRMTPTPHHPGCATRVSYGMAVDWATWNRSQFMSGKNLQRSPAQWRVDVQGRTFYSPDPVIAKAWVDAANHIRHRLGAVMTQA